MGQTVMRPGFRSETEVSVDDGGFGLGQQDRDACPFGSVLHHGQDVADLHLRDQFPMLAEIIILLLILRGCQSILENCEN